MKKILSLQSTNKGKLGVCEFSSGRKVFFKVCNYPIVDEIEGYNKIRNDYNVAKRLYYNYDRNLIVYEYNDNLFSRTLHYGLYEGGDFDSSSIVNMLTAPFENMQSTNEEKCINSKFYKQRINMLDNYLNSDNDLFKKHITCDEKEFGTFEDVLKRIRNSISESKDVHAVITQGDPTDLNIGIGGEITDYEVAGVNSAIGEIAIFLGCFIVNSYYYYIKYVNSSHKLYTKTLDSFGKFIKPSYEITDKGIKISLNNFLPRKNKEFILEYLNAIRNYKEFKDNPHLGKYIAFRFMSPVNLLSVVEEKDLVFLMGLATKFESFTSVEEIINYLKEI